eukprot:1381639-Prymnesium_polylepis.1
MMPSPMFHEHSLLCEATRAEWTSPHPPHHTFYIPLEVIENGTPEERIYYTQALCCLYTWVEVASPIVARWPYLVRYDTAH